MADPLNWICWSRHVNNVKAEQQNSNHTQTYCELFHQPIHKHATHKTNRTINRATYTIQAYNITLTTTQVQEAIKQSKNNIVPIPKTNKGIDKGTSYRPISLLSVNSKTLEKILLPYITANIANPPTQTGTNTTLYSDGTTHSKHHRSKGVKPNGSSCANNHCSTRYEQSFRHNKHTHTYQTAATYPDTRHNH